MLLALLADLLPPGVLAAGLVCLLRSGKIPLGSFSWLPGLKTSSWLFLLLLLATLSLVGVNLLWSTFMIYDDEGYVLYTLKSFAENGALYDKVYTQYGPFYYQLGAALHKIGLPFTNNAARAMNLVAWSGSALFCALAVYRVSRGKLPLAILTLVTVFSYLWPLTSEPAHPGAFICLSIALCAWLGAEEKLPTWGKGLLWGLAAGALFLTKINIGVFLLAGAGSYLLFHSPFCARKPLSFLPVALLLIALPWLLMHSLLREPWVLQFAANTSLALAGVLLAAWPSRKPSFGLRPLLAFGSAFLGVCVLSLLVLHVQGSSWNGIVEGVFLAPLRMPSVFTNPLRWRDGSFLFSLCSLAGAALSLRSKGMNRAIVLSLLRFGLLLIFCLIWTGLLDENLHAWVVCFGLSLSWALVAPLSDSKADCSARVWLALLVIPQTLHAYPVAGSQLSWGSFLWIPLLALSCAEAIEWLGALTPRLSKPLANTFLAALAILACGMTFLQLRQSEKRRTDGVPLSLSGAETIVLPASLATTLQVLDANAREHAKLLHTFPGMLGFNLRSERPAPTFSNATHWFNFLSGAQQEEIREKLEADSDSCIVVENSLLAFLRERKISYDSPLSLWLRSHYKPAFRLDGFEFWIRNSREITPVLLATVKETERNNLPRYQISLRLPEYLNATDCAAIELAQIQGNRLVSQQIWTGPALQLVVTHAGTRRLQSIPGQFPAGALLELHVAELHPGFSTKTAVLRFLTSDGRCAFQARFEDTAP